MERECKKCKKLLPVTEFYGHAGMTSGVISTCKNCVKARVNKRYKKLIKDPAFLNAERERSREKNHRLGYLEKWRVERSDERKRVLQAAKEAWARRNPAAKKATTAVHNAVRDGRLFKQPCEVCGAIEVEGHHDDYDKPLEVRWLCDKHHKQLHIRLRKLELLGE